MFCVANNVHPHTYWHTLIGTAGYGTAGTPTKYFNLYLCNGAYAQCSARGASVRVCVCVCLCEAHIKKQAKQILIKLNLKANKQSASICTSLLRALS